MSSKNFSSIPIPIRIYQPATKIFMMNYISLSRSISGRPKTIKLTRESFAQYFALACFWKLIFQISFRGGSSNLRIYPNYLIWIMPAKGAKEK